MSINPIIHSKTRLVSHAPAPARGSIILVLKTVSRARRTEHRGRVNSTPVLYSKDPGLKSRPRDRLSSSVTWISSVRPDGCRDCTSNEVMIAIFHILCNSLFSYYLIQRYIILATDGVISTLISKLNLKIQIAITALHCTRP
jgi:hypothetical protein